MAELTDRKLYLGPRLRVLRRELGINQTQMAEELGVSPSYLNHLERNQRPLTAQMLLRLANTYDIDIREFVAGAGEAAGKALGEIFSDAIVRDIGIPRHEMIEVAENYPGVSEAIGRFYRAIVDFRRMPDMIEEIGSARIASSPLEWLRSFAEAQGNHFAGIDGAAEGIAAALGEDPAQLQVDLRARLAGHGIKVMAVPERVLGDALRHYDFHRRRLMLAERLRGEGRLFALAYQLCAAELSGAIDEAIARSGAPDEETQRLLLVALTNYAAAALVMPYGRFHEAAEESRYDLDLLEARFGVSFEALAHRLTTLNRTGARGVPFFMLKIDVAGTISKRFTGEDFPFARFGGACPRWDIHASFRRPGEILVQSIETPDEKRYFTLCKALPRARDRHARSQAAIGLGCELKHAERLVYAEQPAGRVAPTTVGPACHVCEREACPDRALPPVTRSLDMSQHVRAASSYPFRRV
jgi:predicted transcriptional regulator/DNA-binding XRE family transcriptional regulator